MKHLSQEIRGSHKGNISSSGQKVLDRNIAAPAPWVCGKQWQLTVSHEDTPAQRADIHTNCGRDSSEQEFTTCGLYTKGVTADLLSCRQT